LFFCLTYRITRLFKDNPDMVAEDYLLYRFSENYIKTISRPLGRIVMEIKKPYEKIESSLRTLVENDEMINVSIYVQPDTCDIVIGYLEEITADAKKEVFRPVDLIFVSIPGRKLNSLAEHKNVIKIFDEGNITLSTEREENKSMPDTFSIQKR